MMFDVLIQGARTIDGARVEVGIEGSKIVAVGSHVDGEAAQVVRLDDGDLLSPGWIDDHVHCFPEMDLYYDYPDKIGVEKGVTTVIDAGTTGADNIGRFYEIASEAKTNVYAMVNVSRTGITSQDELSDLARVNEDLVAQSLREFSDFAIAIKARMSKSVVGANGVEPLRYAKRFQQELGVPMMVHVGSNPPGLDEVLGIMEAGDIMTHVFNAKPNGIVDEEGRVKDFVWDARDRGVLFDLGHGTDSFNFEVASKALSQGFRIDTVSTDIYVRNRTNGPVFDLSTTMDKMRCVGYGWSEIIDRVTRRPARSFGLRNKGKIEVGADADITIYRIEQGGKELVDSNGDVRSALEQVRPIKTVIGGVVYDNEQ